LKAFLLQEAGIRQLLLLLLAAGIREIKPYKLLEY